MKVIHKRRTVLDILVEIQDEIDLVIDAIERKYSLYNVYGVSYIPNHDFVYKQYIYPSIEIVLQNFVRKLQISSYDKVGNAFFVTLKNNARYKIYEFPYS